MPTPRAIRSCLADVTLALATVASLHAVARPGAIAERLDLTRFPWTDRLFYIASAVAFVLLGCLAVRLLGRLKAAGRRWRRDAAGGSLARGTAGTVMAEFALVLPIMLLVAGMIVQLALIVNASLVVRYAAFTAARSAIVNFEYEYFALPPLQEVFDQRVRKDPELAAELVLASLSPRHARTGAAAESAMGTVLEQRGGAWPNRGYTRRRGYANLHVGPNEATRLVTDMNGPGTYFQSLSPLVPRLEHVVPPHLLDQGGAPRMPAPNAQTLIPTAINISITVGPVTVPLPPIPIPPVIRNPAVNALNRVTNVLATASAAAWTAFADSPLNRDPFAPKRVVVEVEYYFVMTVPGMSLIGVTDPAPWDSSVRVMKISHAVELQSTGTRQAGILAFVPVWDSTPLFW